MDFCRWYVEFCLGGYGRLRTTLVSTSLTLSTGKWYNVKLSIFGAARTIYLNDGARLTATDTQIGNNTTSLGVYHASANFDEFLVTQ